MAGPAEEVVFGARYLDLVTRLAQRLRLADPVAGMWEAADFQWWWRRPSRSDDWGQLFWLDERGEPVAAVVVTDWNALAQCDVLVLGDAVDPSDARRRALGRLAELALDPVEITVQDGDPEALEDWLGSGFSATGERGASCWLDAAQCPPVSPLPEGFVLRSRALTIDRPHPMIERNGPLIATRLSQCSLYRADLDLAVETEDGELAGYSIYWADPVTGVGLVEPMRTQEPFEGLGIATHMLTTGLGLLVSAGCTRLKVSAERGLYTRAGLVALVRDRTLRHEGPW